MLETRLYLTSLGGACLHRIDGSGGSVALLGRGKPVALLVYLAHTGDRCATRDELLDLLWAHLDPEKARGTLRQTLYSLRNMLGEAALSTDGRYVRLSEQVHVDTQDFWAAIQAGDAERAVECYRGRFLPDLALPGGEGFEQWADGERARLERAHLRAAEGLVRDRLDRSHAAEGVRLARTLRDSYPLRQSVWRLLLEALAAAGEILSLRVAADACERLLAAEGLTPEPATVSRLQAARVNTGAARGDDSGALIAELVGREREFATLVTLWKESRTGTPRHGHVVASAGLGKTRLLADFALRAGALGGQVVAVRSHPGERAMPYALAADLAESLGARPGASAVSPAAAQVLVSLAPTLSSHFATAPSIVSSEDTLRQRVWALSELVCAVSEEKPLALLIDDLHWSDPESRQVVLGLMNRLRGRSLLVTATRLMEQDSFNTPASVRLPLEALSPVSIRALVASLGLSVEDRDMHALTDALFAISHGSPFLILQTLELAHDRGLLTRDGSALGCDDVSALIFHVRSGDALSARVESLDSDARRLLTLLAVAEMPLASSALAVAAELPSTRVEELLIALAARGMATANGEEWEPAHDAIAEAVQRLASPAERRAMHEAVGRALASSLASRDDYRAAARHFEEAGADQLLASLLRQWIGVCRRGGDMRTASELAADLLGCAGAGHERARVMVKMLPLRERVGRRERRAFWFASAVATAVLVSLGLRPHESSQLQLIVAPLSSERTVDGRTEAFEPTPVLEYRDPRGRLLDATGESVTVRVASGTGHLTGPTRVPLVRGRADFPRTGVRASGPIVLEFATTRGHASVSVPLGDADSLRERPLKIISGEAGGVALDAADPEIRVGPGAVVTGFVSVEYTSTFADATIWFGATPTWGTPQTSFTSFGALSTPARRRSRTERIVFTAPGKPGRYYYLLMWGPEPSAEYLFSATNWAVGAPRWDDGNEVANTPAPVIEQAMKSGWLPVRVYKNFEGVRGYHSQRVAIAAIRVTVESASRSAAPLNRSASARGPRASASGGALQAP